MKILEPNAGALTNFEVLNFLKAKGAGKQRSRLIASVHASEYKVYDYLVQPPAGNQTSQLVNEFIVKCKEYDLAKSEIINIINIRPHTLAYINPILEQWDDEEKMNELVETVLCIFPPAPNPEENDNAEATDNGIPESLAEMKI